MANTSYFICGCRLGDHVTRRKSTATESSTFDVGPPTDLQSAHTLRRLRDRKNNQTPEHRRRLKEDSSAESSPRLAAADGRLRHVERVNLSVIRSRNATTFPNRAHRMAHDSSPVQSSITFYLLKKSGEFRKQHCGQQLPKVQPS